MSQASEGLLSARDWLKQVPGLVPLVRGARKVLGIGGFIDLQPRLKPGEYSLYFTPSYCEDGVASVHWLTTSERFEAAYARARATGLSTSSDGLKWRAHVTCWAASVGAKLGGAFVECGVNRGFHSRIICDCVDDLPNFYLMDTYKGFDERTLSQKQIEGLKAWHVASGRTGDWQQGMYDECYHDVVKTFSDKPQVKIIRGTVPDTLTQVTEERIAYLSIDMNCAMPEIAAIEYFWPKMVPGAVTVLDDYGWRGHDEQRHAWDAWAKRNGAPLMSMPTGQGIIIKA